MHNDYFARIKKIQKNKGSFGIVLRIYRKKQGITQEQLGARVNVVRSFICSLEHGKKQPSLDMIFRLATALGVKPGDLVDEAAEKAAEKKLLP